MKILKLLFWVSLLPFVSVQGRIIKVLAIGNSFSEDAVEQNLYELAIGGGDTLIIGNIYRPGQSLQSHWKMAISEEAFEYRKIENGKKTNVHKKMHECITDENWDYITFQQASYDSGLLESYEPWLSNLLEYVRRYITNSTVKIGLHQTWAYAQNSTHSGFSVYGNSQIDMYQAIVTAVSIVAQRHANEIAFVVPSGTAIQNLRNTFVGDTLCRDGYHLSLGLGRYTAACTWLEIITGQNPETSSYSPSSLTEQEVLLARKAAHTAVLYPYASVRIDE